MDAVHSGSKHSFRLTFNHSMTTRFSAELEDKVIDAMRRHKHLEVDLSAVREIDSSGVRLIELLTRLGGKEVDFVATSPVVERATRHLIAAPLRKNE